VRATTLAAVTAATAICSLPVPAVSQEPDRRVSMEEAVRLFAENNLEIRIAGARRDAVRGVARQSRAYFNPVPFYYREDLNGNELEYWEWLLGLEQTIEWPGRTSARIEAASRRMDAASAAFAADSVRLAFEVRRSYVQAWALEEQEAVLEVTAAAIRHATTAAERRYGEDDISGYELRRLRIERARIEQTLAVTRLEASATRRTLGMLILPEAGLAEVGPAEPVAGSPPIVARDVALASVAHRPSLRAAEEDYAAASATASAASQAWIPEATLTLGYKDQRDGFSGPVFGVALPLPVFDQKGGLADAANARAVAAAKRLDLHRTQARNDVLAALGRYESIRERLELMTDGLLDGAEDLLQVAGIAYSEGEFSLVEVLDAAAAFRDARVIGIETRADVWIGYFDLLRAMGTPEGRLAPLESLPNDAEDR
jgi:cobalt-zinc-cadmium efflux system outer membrane protein